MQLAKDCNAVLGLKYDGNVCDLSLTKKGLKRDFLVWAGDLLVIAGEFKRGRTMGCRRVVNTRQ